MDGEIQSWPAEHELDSSGVVRLQRSQKLCVRQPEDVKPRAEPFFSRRNHRIQQDDARNDGISGEMTRKGRVVRRDAERQGVPDRCV